MSFREWHQYTLDEVCILITDGSHTSPPSVENGYFMASVKDMTRFGFDFANCRKISEVDFLKLCKNGCSPQKGDVLIGKDGARYLEDILIFNQNEKVVILSSIAILRPDLSKINPTYLFYYLDNREMKKFIKSNYGSGSAIPRMVLKNFKKVPMSIPNIRNQEAIAHILSNLDKKIEVNNQINKTMEKMAQAIFKQWFVDFEFLNEDGEPYQSSGGEMVESELGLVPKGWEVGILGDLIQITSGKRPPRRSDKNEKNFIFPLVGASSVMGFSEEYNFNEAVLVIGRVGTHGIIQRFDRRIWASDNTLVIRSKMYEYVYQILNLIDYSALNRGSTQPLITQTDIKNYSILVPTLAVLNNFQSTVGTLFKRVINNQNENEILKAIRDELLPKLMSGEIKALSSLENRECQEQLTSSISG
jgi:type I restriction enzyme S subunit